MTAALRRLPGVRFEVPPPALDETLPRMDIAFFVGFATRGPLERAVAVESLTEFEQVYGTGITLARDLDTGADVTGLLHPCVRSFFSQGGRRCWILRVAGESAHTGVFPVPGMLMALRTEPGQPWRLQPATLLAASPGSGADTLRLAARIETRVLRMRPVAQQGSEAFVLQAPAAAAEFVAIGDLLRFDRHGVRLHTRVQDIREAAGTLRVAVQGWCALRPLAAGTKVLGLALREDEDAPGSPPPEVLAEVGEQGAVQLRSALLGELPQVGQAVTLRLADEESAWMALTQVDVVQSTVPGELPELMLRGQAWKVAPAAALVAAWGASGAEQVAQRLRVQLQVREGQAPAAESAPLRMTHAGEAGQGSVGGLADALAFPLASPPAEGEALWLPLAELAGSEPQLAPYPSALLRLERDGLAEFSWGLFAEPSLARYSSDVLADRAEALRHASRIPRALHGMHALFGNAAHALMDESTLLAVPDAVHPGWTPVPDVEPWTELDPQPEPPAEIAQGFIDCGSEPLVPPAFERGADPDAAGTFTLYWTEVIPGATYRLEEASDAAFATATPLYEGTGRRFAVAGKRSGAFHYRVRAWLGARRSWWSAPVRVEIGRPGFQTRPWQSQDLLSIHRLMLRCAAGRGDVLAVLTLPAHYDRKQAAAHAEALRDIRPHAQPEHPPVIGADEGRALSHGALYHPWLVIGRGDDILRFPPDGAACGQLAGSALKRGAWIAVANQPLRDVVALTPAAIAPEAAHRLQLLEAQVNLVRGAPHGFVLSTADTLSTDAPWRPVNVRRLMCLLRRLALRRGTTYVFEPNGPALQRTVERSFGAMLDQLFRRGAFAGAQPEAAYRVEAGEELNTQRRRDAGQFWVQLKVAPALPLSFLTVRVVREGERVVSRELH